MENSQNSAGSRRKSVGLLSQTLVIKNDDGTDQEEMYQHPATRRLSPLEKRYLLAAEHGDVATVKKILEKCKSAPSLELDIDCMDPLGRTAVRMSIDNENLDMLETLLAFGVHPKDGLLHAINAEFVEAVELLIEYEEFHHKDGKPYSWEQMEIGLASFTPEITPLILAAHKDNYEILKLLLDRGASLPLVHDVKCSCRECKIATQTDCLKHSRSRISSYKALASPSLICLSSMDPIFTAFELSYELRRLSGTENEFKQEYLGLQKQCQKFATDLVDQVRNSEELEAVLTYDGAESKMKGKDTSSMRLPRIEMAIKYKQKTFIAHANVQQLLMSIWYEGMSEFRRKSSANQMLEILGIGVMFPLYASLYMLCPTITICSRIRKPFFKFIMHSFSYLFFLLLLILASQRVESLIIELLGTEDMKLEMKDEMRKQRGQIPTITEFGILLFVIAHITEEVKDVWRVGFFEYFGNMWNIIDNMRNTMYVVTIALRTWAYIQERMEAYVNPDSVYIPREAWDTFDPNLLADGFFAAGNIFAAIKLVHMFSINQYLGPLQVSLGRMVIDIIKFFFIYTLVLFAFACGMNQLMWYYSDLEKQQCFSGNNGEADWDKHRDNCIAWRRFSNLFESSQTLFWASFGLIDIGNFDLTGIKDYTRFWGLLMFGSYSVINVVVLLNLLIAMMSNSYHIISERSDVEWKFARTKLFLNYFEEGGTLPPPFNCLPNVKHLMKLFTCKLCKCCKCCKSDDEPLSNDKNAQKTEIKYQIVMRNLVWRYITERQHQLEHRSVTEDDINEIRQDINTFRYQMLDVFQNNGMDTANIRADRMETAGKKIKIRERRLLKDFSISLVEDTGKKDQATNDEVVRRKFQELTRTASGKKTVPNRSSLKWRELIFSSGSPIGKTKNRHTMMKTDSIKQRLENEISMQLENRLRRKSRSIEYLPGIQDKKGQVIECKQPSATVAITITDTEYKKKVGFDVGSKAQDSVKQKQGSYVPETKIKPPEAKAIAMVPTSNQVSTSVKIKAPELPRKQQKAPPTPKSQPPPKWDHHLIDMPIESETRDDTQLIDKNRNTPKTGYDNAAFVMDEDTDYGYGTRGRERERRVSGGFQSNYPKDVMIDFTSSPTDPVEELKSLETGKVRETRSDFENRIGQGRMDFSPITTDISGRTLVYISPSRRGSADLSQRRGSSDLILTRPLSPERPPSRRGSTDLIRARPVSPERPPSRRGSTDLIRTRPDSPERPGSSGISVGKFKADLAPIKQESWKFTSGNQESSKLTTSKPDSLILTPSTLESATGKQDGSKLIKGKQESSVLTPSKPETKDLSQSKPDSQVLMPNKQANNDLTSLSKAGGSVLPLSTQKSKVTPSSQTQSKDLTTTTKQEPKNSSKPELKDFAQSKQDTKSLVAPIKQDSMELKTTSKPSTSALKPSKEEKKDSAPSKPEKKDSAPSKPEKKDSAPSKPEKKDSAPSKPEKKDSAPSKEEKKDSAPSKEEKKDSAPSKEEKKDSAPSKEEKKDSAPSKEEKKDSAPSKEEKKDSAPSKEEKKDSAYSKPEKKDSAPSKEEKKDSAPSKPEKKDSAPSKPEKKDSAPSKPEKKDLSPSKPEKKDLTPSKEKEKDLFPSKQKEKDLFPGKEKGKDLFPGKEKEKNLFPSKQKEKDLFPSKQKEKDLFPGKEKGKNLFPSKETEEDLFPGKQVDLSPGQGTSSRRASSALSTGRLGSQLSPSDMPPSSRRGSRDISPSSRRGSRDVSSRRDSNATRAASSVDDDDEAYVISFNGHISTLGRRSPTWF